MPIIGKGKNTSIQYRIPADIKSRIPQQFYQTMYQDLLNVFGKQILRKDAAGDYQINYMCGTYGWTDALHRTCYSFGMEWLWEYYDDLPWYDSDLFDCEIAEELVAVMQHPPTPPNEKKPREKTPEQGRFHTWKGGKVIPLTQRDEGLNNKSGHKT